MQLAAVLLLAQMQVSGPPVATIGAVDGDTLHTLSSVTAAQEDRHGNLYVVQQRTPFIAVYDSLGERIATLGRRGRGPGEFSWATHVTVLRDTIYISDVLLGKIAVYSPVFQHVRDILVRAEYPGLTGGRSETARVSPTFVTDAGFVASIVTPDSAYIAFQPWSGSPTVLDQYPMTDRQVTAVVPGHNLTLTVEGPLPEVPMAVPAAGSLYLFRPQPAPVLWKITPSGRGTTRALSLQQEEVPPSIKTDWVERFIEQFPPGASPAPPDALRSAFEEAATLPERSAFATLRAGGPDGDIWLEQKLPGRPVRMVRVTPTGQLVGTFDVPDGATVLSIRAGHVWLLELDELDVPFLRRYRLLQ